MKADSLAVTQRFTRFVVYICLLILAGVAVGILHSKKYWDFQQPPGTIRTNQAETDDMPSDVYQMLSYLVAYKCPKGVLIYPKGECEDVNIPIEVESKQYTIHVKQIDLAQLNEKNLRDFALSMDNYLTI